MYNKNTISDLLKSDLLKGKKESLCYINAPSLENSAWTTTCQSDFDTCSTIFLSHDCIETKCAHYGQLDDQGFSYASRAVCLGVCSLEKIQNLGDWSHDYSDMIFNACKSDYSLYTFNIRFKSSITNQIVPRLAFMIVKDVSEAQYFRLKLKNELTHIKPESSCASSIDYISYDDYSNLLSSGPRYKIGLHKKFHMYVDLCSLQTPSGSGFSSVTKQIKEYILTNYSGVLGDNDDDIYFKTSVNFTACDGNYMGSRLVLIRVSRHS